MTDFPRRSQIQKMTPEELAIRDAILAVERLGADSRLTDAVVLLEQAKGSVADYVDQIPSSLPRGARFCTANERKLIETFINWAAARGDFIEYSEEVEADLRAVLMDRDGGNFEPALESLVELHKLSRKAKELQKRVHPVLHRALREKVEIQTAVNRVVTT